MDYLHGVSVALAEPVLRYIFIGFLWILVAAIGLVLAIILWQFYAMISAAKHQKDVKTHIPEAFVLAIVIAAILTGGVWLLRHA